MQKREYLTAICGGIGAIGASVATFRVRPVAQAQRSAALFTSHGKLQIPKGFRRWVVFVGAPLTPNGLNGDKANPSKGNGWSGYLTGKNSTQGGDR